MENTVNSLQILIISAKHHSQNISTSPPDHTNVISFLFTCTLWRPRMRTAVGVLCPHMRTSSYEDSGWT